MEYMTLIYGIGKFNLSMENSLVETLKLAGWVDWVEPRCRRLSRLAGKGLVDQLWLNGSNRGQEG